MNESTLISLVISVIIATLGFIKLELIREYVKKVVGNNFGSQIYSISLIVIIALTPVFLDLAFSEEEQATEPEPAPVVIPEDKTGSEIDIEAIADITVMAFDKTKEIIEEEKRKNAIKDSIYEATREKRWVYQLGDIARDAKLLATTYEQIQNEGNIYIFKDSKKNYFLFKDDQWEKTALEDSLQVFKIKLVESIPKVDIVDLAGFCNRKQKLKIDGTQKLRLSDGKVELTCFTCDK